uniref:Protein kinase domain-containing protein n=1 Tax=Oryza punctata TaxID=4537 RepID=A0A0E0KAY8_ORYPU
MYVWVDTKVEIKFTLYTQCTNQKNDIIIIGSILTIVISRRRGNIHASSKDGMKELDCPIQTMKSSLPMIVYNTLYNLEKKLAWQRKKYYLPDNLCMGDLDKPKNDGNGDERPNCNALHKCFIDTNLEDTEKEWHLSREEGLHDRIKSSRAATTDAPAIDLNDIPRCTLTPLKNRALSLLSTRYPLNYVHKHRDTQRQMEHNRLCILAVVIALCQLAGGQAVTDAAARARRFACNVSAPCDTFVVYRTQSPGFLDLGNVSDLFGVSRALIASANKLTTEDGVLLPGQPLLVPVKCGCTGARSFANVTYPIRPRDTFFGLAVTAFENLTDFVLVEELNPAAEATRLEPWQEVVVPLFCRCPTREELSAGSRLLVTYVWQAGDDVSVVSTLMNASAANISASNGVAGNSNFATGQPVLIPVSQPPRFPPLSYGAIATDSRGSKRRRGIIVAASIAGSFVACAALCTAILAYRRYRKKASVPRPVSPKLSWTKSLNRFGSNSSIARMINGGDKLLTSVSQFIDKPIIFREEEIMEATMNLDEQCKLGSSYYRANLEGEVFAVKPAKGNIAGELRMMQMVNHANLIKLAGISIGADGDYAFLVYEFAEKGSLDKWLYQKPPCSLPSSSSMATLSWDQRLGIALDVANGLLYMHEHTQPSMVHGDVRARNILLTAGFRAKLSNFSLAKPAATVDAAATSSDVFAFGLLLLELLSGRRAVEARVGAEIGMLWTEIRAVLDAGGDKRVAKLKKWMDPALGGEYGMDAALSLAGMARACTEEDAARRPKMAEIAFSLSVLGQPLSVADAFERLWQPSSEDSIGIGNTVAAR